MTAGAGAELKSPGRGPEIMRRWFTTRRANGACCLAVTMGILFSAIPGNGMAVNGRRSVSLKPGAMLTTAIERLVKAFFEQNLFQQGKCMSCALQRLSISFAILLTLSPINPPQTAAQTSRLTYPPARRVDQADTYHGVAVPDPYRWLEQRDSDETKDWLKAQDELIQRQLAGTHARAAIRARLTELAQTDSYGVPRKANGRYFYTYTAAGRPLGQSVVYMQVGLEAEPHPLFDARSRLGEDVTISWISPSPDGRSLAYS